MHQHATLGVPVSLFFGTNDSDGNAVDADSVTYDVREGGSAPDAAPVLSGTPVLLQHANFPNGAYDITLTPTEALGFFTGKTYAVFCSAAVGPLNPIGLIGSFTIGPVPAVVSPLGGTLQSVVGTVSSASYYGTVQTADQYFQYKIYGPRWLSKDSDLKIKGLMEATERIDFLNFIGSKTDKDQTLQWPRNGSSEIHQNVIKATFEIAFKLVDGHDPDVEYDILRKTGANVGPSNSSYDTRLIPEHIVNGIPSLQAWRFLRPLIRSGNLVTLNRS